MHEDVAGYIRFLVQELPAKYREALLLTEYDGLTQVELAKQLGLSVSAAKSRVQSARAMMRVLIGRCCELEVDAYGTVVECIPKPCRCSCLTQAREAKPIAQ